MKHCKLTESVIDGGFLYTCPTCGNSHKYAKRKPRLRLPCSAGKQPAAICPHRGKLLRDLPGGMIDCRCGRVRLYPCGLFNETVAAGKLTTDASELLTRLEDDFQGRTCATCEAFPGKITADRPIVPVLMPSIYNGGTETWFYYLAKHAKRFDFRLCITGDIYDQGVAGRIRSVATIVTDPAQIHATLAAAACVVAWNVPDLPSWLQSTTAPSTIMCHGQGSGNWFRRWFEQYADLTPNLVAVSADAGQAFGGRPHTVIHNGIDTQRCQPKLDRDTVRESWGINPDAKVFGYLGRIAGNKGLELLCGVARLLPDWTFVAVGPEYVSSIGAMVREAGIHISATEDVGSALAAFDHFAIASESEGCCLAILEALAAGLPVITTPVGAAPYLHSKGAVQLASTAAEFAGGIRNCDQYDASKARSLIDVEFTAQAMAGRWEKYIDGLIANKAR